jgi:hypothetical protein
MGICVPYPVSTVSEVLGELIDPNGQRKYFCKVRHLPFPKVSVGILKLLYFKGEFFTEVLRDSWQ